VSDDDGELVQLPEGHTLALRTATLADVPGLTRMYKSLSDEDRYRRFFSVSRPRKQLMERFVEANEKGGLWLVAVADDGTIVADVGYTLLANGDAEVAITVSEHWRGWLGPFLLETIAERAAARGIHNLRATILLENRKMLRLAARRGCAIVDYPDASMVELTMATDHGIPGWAPVHDRPRLLVEGCGGRWHGLDAARRAGWDVIACAGPGSSRVGPCPLLTEGGHCPLVDDADEIVTAFPASDERGVELAAAHARRGTAAPIVADADWRPEAVPPIAVDAPATNEKDPT
jgi:RimJ/RimL family protein N-acetyltransferase